MSGDDTPAQAVVPYKVGYGRPPVSHQFKGGQSGNPRGRPKGSTKATGSLLSADRAKALLIEEAYRPVRVRDGESVIELPAIQAVFRAMGVSAMQGNRLSQRTLAELVSKVEGERTAILTVHYNKMVDYKLHWEGEIDRCRRQGRPEPDPVPHPANIIIDARTGDVRIVGPMTSEEKAYYESVVVMLRILQAQVSQFSDAAKRARSGARRDAIVEQWHSCQREFDEMNDVIAPLYRTELRDRSYHPDASRPGEFARRMGVKLPGPPPPMKFTDAQMRLLETPNQ